MKRRFRNFLLSGLAVWLPIIVTFAIVRFIVDLLDQTIALIPNAYQPEALLGYDIPGLGVIFSLIIVIITGLFARNFLGIRIVAWSESILDRIPLVRTVYNGTKQVIQTVFSSNSQAFRKVLLIEYPRKGMWSVAFQTSICEKPLNSLTNTNMVSVFIPTTPNPTSGFMLLVAEEDAIELPFSVEEGFKYIISLGVMYPVEEVKKIKKNRKSK